MPIAKQLSSIARLLRPYGLWNQVWNFDVHQRYVAARSHLVDTPAHRIVEVGAGNAGLGFLLKCSVLAIDLAFNAEVLRQCNPYLVPVIGNGTRLPLGNDTMEAALSLDSIEHVPPNFRKQAIHELMRVASRRVVISVPCGDAANDADRRLIQWYRSRYGDNGFWLTEHVDNGLPTEAFMRGAISDCALILRKEARVTVFPHVPILIHDVSQRVLAFANYRFCRIISLGLWAVLPMLRPFAGDRYYRYYVVIDLNSWDPPTKVDTAN